MTKLNEQLANKRVELINKGFKPTETTCVGNDNGCVMTEKWESETEFPVVILIVFEENGTVKNVVI